MEENEASIQTLQVEISTKTSDSEKLKIECETKLNQMQEKMKILEEQISAQERESTNLGAEKDAFESKAANLERDIQRLSEETKGFQTGASFIDLYKLIRLTKPFSSRSLDFKSA